MMPLVFLNHSNRNSARHPEAIFSGVGRCPALKKDQVNHMLYGRSNLSMRTLLQLTAVLLFVLVGTWPAYAAGNSGPAPQLVPFTMGLMAGNPATTISGYGGDGGPGSNATLNGVSVLAVDSVGNVYFPDRGNAIIREINGQTGVISTVAGVDPSLCTGTACNFISTGCADGVPALGNPIGAKAIWGIAVDGFGNVYFSDQTTATISVIYRGGSQVANFIKLENPTGVTNAGGVIPGYVYHVAGTINLSTCAGTATANASSSKAAVPAGDGSLAFQNATLGTVGPLALDSAGNLYLGDNAPEGTIRVINTQSTTQTFYQYQVAPGAIQSIANCGAFTVTCPVGYGSSPVTIANTGLGGPANAGVMNVLANNQGQYMNVDAYGNIYELNYKGATPDILIAATYAGGQGNPLQGLINTSLSGDTYVAGANSLTAQAGDFYYLLHGANPIIRPSSIVADPFGNLYYQDNHYGETYRVDVNATASSATLLEFSSAMFATNKSNLPSSASPKVFCYPVNSNVTYPGIAGYQTSDQWGDGCPAIYADGPGDLKNVNGYGSTITDGLGNLYIADQSHNLVRKVTMGNIFPMTPVGQTFNATTLTGQQELQFHFDQKNLPLTETTIAPIITSNSFAIAPGISDFTINTISSNFIANSASGIVSGIVIGLNTFTQATSTGIVSDPICANNTGSNDSSLDCIVNVVFSPTAPGLRQAQLVVNTANGSAYSFGLTGYGVGGQLAIDGGTPTPLSLSGIGNPAQVAVTQSGTVYVADPGNNRVVSIPANGGSQSTVGTGLKGPMGVAVDAAGNVFISDTGNNRIVEVQALSGKQTVLGQIVATGSPAYPQYKFNAPQGLAVDVHGNVFVADTGNATVVEIPAHPGLGGATPLLQYTGAAAFVHPVGIALDVAGNIYVADTGKIQIVELPAGGGDLQNLPSGSSLLQFASSAVQNGVFKSPSGVAVDAAGNLYVSDSATNTVYEVPSGSGPGSEQIALNFTKLNLAGSNSSLAGGSIALDANGSLDLADSGNSQVLFENRQNPVVDFGTVAEGQPASSTTLTLTNIGNAALSLNSPFTQITSTPAGNTAFTSTNTCSGSSLAVGLHCTLTTNFMPTAVGPQSALVAINGGTQAINLKGAGEVPLVNITLAVTSPSSGVIAGSPATITATLTPQSGNNAPTGTVSFSYTVNGTSAGAATVASVTNGVATLNLPTLAQGRLYVVSAVYQGDAFNSQTTATPLSVYVPGIPVTATANSVTFSYGNPVPTITGTVTGILPADQSSVTYKFVSAATQSSPVGVYPITVVFSGGNYLNYGFPTVLTPSGAPATVTETKAPLTVQANTFSTVYGAQNVTLTSTLTGVVNGDGFAIDYSPSYTSILNAGTYPLIPTVKGPVAGNYTITSKNGQITVAQAPTKLAVSATTATVLPNALSTDPLVVVVSTDVSSGIGTPTGTVTLTDTFTPIINTAPGTGTPAAPVTIGPLPLVAGVVSYTVQSQTPGIHSFAVTYNGDNNFKKSTTTTPTTIEVDAADFTLASTTNPIQIAPGVLPGGNNSVAGEAAATPEQAVVTINSVLSFAGTVYLGCQPQNPSYVNCSLSPTAVTLTSSTTSAQSILSISTPATLPLGFFSSELQHPMSTTVLAFIPFGALAFCFRRRRSLSKALWMLAAIATLSVGLSGCGGTTVPFFTPVPAGPQTVTVYACSVQASCTTSNPVSSPLNGTGSGVIRSFTVSINIQ